MTSRSESKPWDFSQALDLINTLSTPSPTTEKRRPSYSSGLKARNGSDRQRDTTPSSLGDFSRLWQFLGRDETSSPRPHAAGLAVTPPNRPSYISDGAIYRQPESKSVKWQDEPTDIDEVTGSALDTEEAGPKKLTKKQRKKQRRRERKELAARQRTASDFESEADIPRPPARKASVHNLIAPESSAARTYDLRPRNAQGRVASQANGDTVHIEDGVQAVDWQRGENGSKDNDTVVDFEVLEEASQALAPNDSESIKDPQSMTSKGFAKHTLPPKQHTGHNLHAALEAGYQHQLPPHVAHVTKPAHSLPPQQPLWLQPGFLHPPNAATHSTRRTKALTIREGYERNLALRLRLIHDFVEDKRWLTSPVPMANHAHTANGIHVFIDYSNIWIGFMDLVKTLTGLHPHERTAHKNMSFDSLVLLLERGRPMAKRVLVGSAPFLPAFDTAKAIGYELSILEKVYKAKELTERQRRYAIAERYYNGDSTGGTDSETATAMMAPEKWVEQGVDEIIHLKMLESIVDTHDVNVSTIVLATGDAAEAEYSAGFMKMVERALSKGWKVELASWSKNMSFMYKRRAFLEQWQGRFRIVDLDDYADYLLDT